MILQSRIFKYDQEKELNEFLRTANLYNTEKMPAIRCLDGHVIVWHNPEPTIITKEMATQTIGDTVRLLKENLVQYEMDVRQFKWRISTKEARKKELEKAIEEADVKIAEIDEKIKVLPQGKASKEERAKLNEERSPLAKARQKDSEELKKVEEQITNGIENNKSTLKKIEDTKKDIDGAMEFIKDIESGDYEIYANPNK